jgi:hypothetical protein
VGSGRGHDGELAEIGVLTIGRVAKVQGLSLERCPPKYIAT